jgi:hypothetical protein
MHDIMVLIKGARESTPNNSIVFLFCKIKVLIRLQVPLFAGISIDIGENHLTVHRYQLT